MKPARSLLLVASTSLALFMLGGGVAVRVGAGDASYRQVVLFSEVLSLVMENYVDPVDVDRLLDGAYEGLLGGLDPNGAYLTPDEMAEWRSGSDDGATAGPGITVLKSGRSLQVVAVEPDSPAERAGIEVGDQIRAVGGRPVQDLSLAQAWRLIHGPPGTVVTVHRLELEEGFQRNEIELERVVPKTPAWGLDVVKGIAVLTVRDVEGIDADKLAVELEHARSRGVERLLLDLRNAVDLEPRRAAKVASLFASGTLLRLRDRSGRLVEVVESDDDGAAWPGLVAILVNGATAGSAEALAEVLHVTRSATVLGTSTYGFGAESKLFPLDNGAGLVVSASLWESSTGESWNGDGIEPDQAVRGEGSTFEEISTDQLEKALAVVETLGEADAEPKVAPPSEAA